MKSKVPLSQGSGAGTVPQHPPWAVPPQSRHLPTLWVPAPVGCAQAILGGLGWQHHPGQSLITAQSEVQRRKSTFIFPTAL